MFSSASVYFSAGQGEILRVCASPSVARGIGGTTQPSCALYIPDIVERGRFIPEAESQPRPIC